jgi:cardiolipin synthase C
MRHLRWLLVALAVAGCELPKNVVRPRSSALVDTHHTLGGLTAPATAKHPGESGFLLFNTGEGAIQARVAMADLAQSSIDAMYFQWGRDTVGRVLLDRIMAAADRGVRVRLLIDDYYASGFDLPFQTIDAHPNMEVRVFNPFVRGRMRVTQLLGRFTELNRRMHEKLFIADGQLAIVGGRNLIDDYFGLGEEICYRDFDLLAMGPVVSQAGAAFDQYWNSQWAYPISSLEKPPSQAEQDWELHRFSERVAADRANFPYALPHDRYTARTWLVQFRGKGIWGPAELVYDDPDSVANPADAPPGRVWKKMNSLAMGAQHEIVIENPYLLPTPKMPTIRALRERGVQLRMLTNSLATTDEVPTSAHYANVRPEMVDLGVELYEMKPYAASRGLYMARPATPRRAWRCTERPRCSTARRWPSDRSISIRARETSTPKWCSLCRAYSWRRRCSTPSPPTSRPRTPGASPTSQATAPSPGSPRTPRGRSSSRTIRPARGGASSGRSSGSCPSPTCSEEGGTARFVKIVR